MRALESEIAALRAAQMASDTAAAVQAASVAAAAEAAAAEAAAAAAAVAAAAAADAAAAAAEAAENAECSMCLLATKNAAFIPCGHACVCLQCGTEIAAQRNATRPVCRISVTSCMQVFN
jgi:chemosensory pili system protein ChpA (sensor histidine kinase/response regulator)